MHSTCRAMTRGWRGWLRDPGDRPAAIRARPQARKAAVVAGLGLEPEHEAELLAAWHTAG